MLFKIFVVSKISKKRLHFRNSRLLLCLWIPHPIFYLLGLNYLSQQLKTTTEQQQQEHLKYQTVYLFFLKLRQSFTGSILYTRDSMHGQQKCWEVSERRVFL